MAEEQGANVPPIKIYPDKFSGQVVVVTGAAQGIGAVTARCLASKELSLSSSTFKGKSLNILPRQLKHRVARPATGCAMLPTNKMLKKPQTG